MSKSPKTSVRMDVCLNVLEYPNVYTYFLGRLDVNPEKFQIQIGYSQYDDDDHFKLCFWF